MFLTQTIARNQQTKAFWLVTGLVLTVVLLLPSSAQAQGNYVYVNNQDVSNSISAYSVSASGALTAISGSPFLTGGRAANVNCYGLDRIVISAPNHVLFVTNTLDLTISALQINPASGSLTPVPGSPFPSGLTLDNCQGISLAATPDGKFLMASSNGQIKTFNIAANGALSLAATTPNCCTPMVGMKISPNGQFLAVSNETSASVFAINTSTGALTSVLGSPFPRTGTGNLSGLDFNSCSSNFLFGGEATSVSTTADAWAVSTAGALSPLPGSPFHSATGTNSNVVLLSPDNRRLFESNQLSNSVNSFTVNADSSLTNIGSFGGIGFLHTPAGMATDQAGNFLYVADDPFGIAVLRINGDGSLTNLSDTAIARAVEIQGVAAYPPASCATADLAVTMTAAPSPVVVLTNVTYTITVTNNGPSAASATIEDVLPGGKLFFVSCSATGGGVCSGSNNHRFVNFPSLLTGQSATATIVAQVSSGLANNSTLSNTVTISNSSAADPNPANNSATATVTVVTLTPTTLTVAPAKGTFGGSAVLSATLKKSADNTPVAGKSVAFTLSGTSVGSAVTDATGVASVTTSVAGIHAGTYPGAVVANFAGDTTFAASSGTASLTVAPAVLTVTANNASRVYGDPNPAFTFTISGFVNGDTAAVVSGSPSCTSAPPTTNVGTYPIVCTPGTLAAANYSFVFIDGTLTVTPAALTVTAANASRVYGDSNPVFTGTLTGIKNGDNITATYSSVATPASRIGSYPIAPTLVDPASKLGNYTVSSNNGTLIVTPAQLTVTAANATRPFSAPNPAFTGAIVGIRNNDNITATYSTPATQSSPAGIYPIIPAVSDNGTGVLSNYTVTLNSGTLTVSPAVITVTANNASRLYGDPNPIFTGIVTGVQNGDNITASYASPANATSPVGTYPIIPTLSDNGTGALANYTVVSNNGILTVNQAPLTVTVPSASRVYGDPNPVFSATIVGIKNGDSITAAVSSTAGLTSAVGTYPIVATLVDPTNKLSNYAVIINNGTLTITPAPLSVSAANASRLFGTPNPPLTGIISGIKNGDPITATYSTTATATSLVGTYPITATLADPAGKLGNYSVTSTVGTLTINSAPTANFVFVNNQVATGNSIAGYSVAVDGTLTALSGSPTLTGGLGTNAACPSVNRLALSAGNNLLFVSNGGDQTISAFQIGPTSGALTPVAGSPFASGLTLDACSGISLSATPDGRFLMASSNGQITTFSIGAGGVLSSISIAANSVTPNASMKISANGQFLAVSNGASASVFAVNPDGSLTAVAGSPFAETGTGSLAGLDFSSTSGLLYGAEASSTAAFADAWSVGTNGALAAIAGSPFSTTAINSNVVLFSPNDTFLFASNTGSASLSSFSIAAGGGLTNLGSFGSSASLHAPVGMATDRSGSLLYVADDTFGVAVFRVDGAGSLAQLGDLAIAGAGQVQDLIAYPPRMASSADLSATVSAASPNLVAGQNATYTITVTNNGADPAAASVADALPSGFSLISCSATGNGACIGNSAAANFYLLQSGESQSITIVASTSKAIPDGTVATNTASITNSSAVDPNTANNSASATVTVAQPATTTLAVAPASATYGGSSVVLSATLSTSAGPIAGEAVNFTLNGSPVGSAVTDATGLATLSASVSGLNAGSYPITASFGGDPNNAPASGNSTLTINPAPLTVIADNASRVYGDPNPAFTGTITGIQNADVITATYASVADPTSAVGTYAIVPTLVDPAGKLGNYSATVSNGILTITPAPLTVTADSASRLYGDPNPAFTGTITGLRNNDNITPAFSSVGPASPVGSYPITSSLVDPTSKAGNYSVIFVNGTLTINPAPLSVTAANASMIYGVPLPAFTGAISPLKNGDNITAIYSTTATSASPVGTYPITPALVDPNNKLGNYTLTSNNGTLTITPASLTVTAANASRLYGDPNPVFTGTITGVRNGDNITATYSSAATQASNVGSYAIVPALSDPTTKLGNYTLVSNNGILTVTSAPLTVTAANAIRLYGDPNPAFTGAVSGLKNGDSITATFSSIADPTSPVGSYAITATLADPGAKLGNYRVVSNNGILTVSPAPLTAAATNASRIYGDPNPVFIGTLTGLKNGDNITATFASAATATSPVGTYSIVPSFTDPAGKLGNYTVSSSGTLTVTPAPLTASANNASRLYGDPNPAFTGTITGLKNGDNITESFTSAGPTSPVGSYPIVPALVDPTGRAGNYAVTFTNATLTVTPAPLSVAAANASRLYGNANPVFTGTITGIKNGENITASFATNATPASSVGTYAITPTLVDPTGKLSNYTVASSNGTLTVTVAPLTVTAANASRTFGAANPAFTGTITGIKNGDNITATFSTTATSSSPVGSYPITPALADPTAKLGNYSVTRINGTLTVNPAPLTITANPQTLILGTTTVAASATYSGFVLGQTPANLTGTLTCAAVNGTGAVGTFAPPNGIACSGQSSTNYAITFVQGTKTVDYEPAGHACTNGPGHAILAPISTAGTTAFGIATKTIPVQFRVCGVNGASVSSAGVVRSFTLVSVNGVAATTPAPLGGPFTFVPGVLASTAGSAGWRFNLSTANLAHKTTYAYRITLNDGTVINFQFHFN